MTREVELGWASWTSFALSCPSCSSTAVQRTLSLWLCPSTAVETVIAQCTSRWATARGHRLNTSIVLAVVHGLSGLFRVVSAVEPSLCRPLPTLSPSLIGHLACGRKATIKPAASFSPSVPAEAGCLFAVGASVHVLISGESLYCFLVGWCTNKSYVIATSDLWLFIHASNLLPSFPTPLPYTCIHESQHHT